MKILFVYEFYTPHVGGGEIALQHLAEGLASRGHEVNLVTLRLPQTLAWEKIHGVCIYRVSVPPFARRYWFLVCALPTIWKLSRQADILHTSTYTAAFPTWFISRLRNKSIVLTVHEYWGKLWKSFSGFHPVVRWFHQVFERGLFLFRFDAYMAVSHFTQQALIPLGIPEQKIRVIYHGIDPQFAPQTQESIQELKQKLYLDEQTFIYLFFGRPGLSKGVEYLVQAIPQISERIPNSLAVLILAKEPAKGYQHILQSIQKLPNPKKVLLLSPVPRLDLPKYLAMAHVIVVPSLSEGFGFSVAEACAVGTPVVATRVGSIPEVISGPHVFIEPKSSLAICHGVEQVWKHNMLHTPLKRFKWSTQVELVEKMYHDLTQK